MENTYLSAVSCFYYYSLLSQSPLSIISLDNNSNLINSAASSLNQSHFNKYDSNGAGQGLC